MSTAHTTSSGGVSASALLSLLVTIETEVQDDSWTTRRLRVLFTVYQCKHPITNADLAEYWPRTVAEHRITEHCKALALAGLITYGKDPELKRMVSAMTPRGRAVVDKALGGNRG